MKTTVNLLSGTQARKKWNDIFKELKENYCQAGILCITKISFKKQGQNKHILGQNLFLFPLLTLTKGNSKECILIPKESDPR